MSDAGTARVTLVAAVARNGVIGAGPDIPWSLPGEQRRFKELTVGHVLVMGRKTYDSIGRPLPGRVTVVVTRQPGWAPAGGPREEVRVAASVPEALAVAARVDPEVFVAGGGEVYAAALPYADRMIVTLVPLDPPGEVVFPSIDPAEWRAVSRDEHPEWSIVHYERHGRPAERIPSDG